jgi:hypothetical protein
MVDPSTMVPHVPIFAADACLSFRFIQLHTISEEDGVQSISGYMEQQTKLDAKDDGVILLPVF